MCEKFQIKVGIMNKVRLCERSEPRSEPFVGTNTYQLTARLEMFHSPKKMIFPTFNYSSRIPLLGRSRASLLRMATSAFAEQRTVSNM